MLDTPAADMDNNVLDIGKRILQKRWLSFVIYVIYCQDADGGCDSVLTTRARIAWKQFCEYLPILTRKGFYLKLIGKAKYTWHVYEVA